jgi:hypothetical protein
MIAYPGAGAMLQLDQYFVHPKRTDYFPDFAARQFGDLVS